MKGWMGGLYRICEWIMRFSAINLLWFVCSLPVVLLTYMDIRNVLTVGAAQAQTLNLYDLAFMLLIPAIPAPFTMFPATSAMFSVARKWIRGEEDAPLFKSFFRGFRDNYLQSMIGGILYTVVFFVLIVNFRFYSGHAPGSLVFVIFLFVFAIFFVSCMNFFNLITHFHMGIWQLIKNSVLITIGKPITSLLILVSDLVILYMGLFKFNFFLVPFFMGSILAYLTFYQFHRAYQKILEKEEKLNQAEEGDEDDGEDGGDTAGEAGEAEMIGESRTSPLAHERELDPDRFRKY